MANIVAAPAPKQTDAQKEADKAAAKAAEDAAARTKIDTDFRTAVAKAAADRDAALSKLDPTSGNIAERAWNDTRSEPDKSAFTDATPPYNALQADFRSKLDVVVDAVRNTGSSGVVGLEAFEARVTEILREQGLTPGDPSAPLLTAEEIAAAKKAGKAK